MRKAKAIVFVIVAFFIFLAPAYADAKRYEVKQGDWLSKIAPKLGVDWKELAIANGIKEPFRIYPGQILNIPENGYSKAVAEAEPFLWKSPGSNPFGHRDFIKAIKSFSMPEKVAKNLIAKVKSEEFEWMNIEAGNQFTQMIFHDFQIVENVIGSWKDKERLLATRLYKVKYAGETFYLVDPLICHNWAWWSDGERISSVSLERLSKKKKMLLLLIPPPMVANYKDEKLISESGIKIHGPDIEATAFSGIYKGVQGQGGKYRYDGIDATFFPAEYETANGDVARIGYSRQGTVWRGEGGTSEFKGSKDISGVEGQYITDESKTSLKLRGGTKRSHIKDGLYESEEKARLTNVEVAHKEWNADKRWFSLMEFNAKADIDRGGDKKSTYGQYDISPDDDPRKNQSEFAAGVKTDIYRFETGSVIPTAEAEVFNRQSDFSSAVEPRAGLKFGDGLFETRAGYQFREGSGTDAAGVGGSIDLGKAIKRLLNFFESKRKKAIN